MSDVLDEAAAMSEDDLERRLRTTYAALARSTRLERTTLDRRAARQGWITPLRLATVAAAVVLLVGLGMIATERRDADVTGVADVIGVSGAQRWGLVTPGTGWQYLGVEPYDPATDGLGEQIGDVIRFRRGDAVLRVMSLRGAVLDDDRLVADEVAGGPPVLATADGRLAVRELPDGLTLVLALDGEVDTDFRPDLVELARQALTVGDDDWLRLQQRQGFATLGGDEPDPSSVFRFENGFVVEREIGGTLRGGVWLAYRTGVVSFGGTPMADEETSVVVASAADRPATVRTTADVVTLDIGGTAVVLHPIVDPDSGVTVRWGSIDLPSGVYEVIGRDATGAVVFRERTRVEAFDEVAP